MSEDATNAEPPIVMKKPRVNIPVPDDDPDDLQFRDLLLKQPPLMQGEDARAFRRFRDDIYADLKPRGPVEEMYVNTVILAYWEFLRLEAKKASYMSGSKIDGLTHILQKMMPKAECKALLKKYALNDPDAIREVEELVGGLFISPDQITAYGFAENISTIQKMDSLISGREASFRKTLKELEGYRELLAIKFKARNCIEEDASSRSYSSHVRQLVR